MATIARLSSKEDYTSLLDRYDTWMLDCDGVIWMGDNALDGIAEALSILRSRSRDPQAC